MEALGTEFADRSSELGSEFELPGHVGGLMTIRYTV
jgi:hypothetical protein